MSLLTVWLAILVQYLAENELISAFQERVPEQGDGDEVHFGLWSTIVPQVRPKSAECPLWTV